MMRLASIEARSVACSLPLFFVLSVGLACRGSEGISTQPRGLGPAPAPAEGLQATSGRYLFQFEGDVMKVSTVGRPKVIVARWSRESGATDLCPCCLCQRRSPDGKVDTRSCIAYSADCRCPEGYEKLMVEGCDKEVILGALRRLSTASSTEELVAAEAKVNLKILDSSPEPSE